MRKYLIIPIISISLCYCTKKSEKPTTSVKISNPEKVNINANIPNSEIDYFEFKPDSISNINIKGFETISSYSYKQTKFATGYYNCRW